MKRVVFLLANWVIYSNHYYGSLEMRWMAWSTHRQDNKWWCCEPSELFLADTHITSRHGTWLDKSFLACSLMNTCYLFRAPQTACLQFVSESSKCDKKWNRSLRVINKNISYCSRCWSFFNLQSYILLLERFFNLAIMHYSSLFHPHWSH